MGPAKLHSIVMKNPGLSFYSIPGILHAGKTKKPNTFFKMVSFLGGLRRISIYSKWPDRIGGLLIRIS